MGKNRRVFSEPKYEINLESKDRVLIRQERKSPLGELLKRIALTTFLVLAAIFIGGLVFNLFSYFFYPAHVYLTVSHQSNAAMLNLAELNNINIYVDGRSKPLRSRSTTNGLVFRFSKRGQHLIGIENLNSRYDSLTFAQERIYLDSLGFLKTKRFDQKTIDNLVFHKILSEQDIRTYRFLSFQFRQRQTQWLHFFVSYSNQSSVVLAEPTCGKNLPESSPLLHDFQGTLFKNLLKFSPHVNSFSAQKYRQLVENGQLNLPTFEPSSWYSDDIRTHRFQYANNMNERLTSSLFLLPYLYKDQTGQAFATLVLAFADIGDITFDPIEIRNIRLTDADSPAADASFFSIIQAYLSLYDSFLHAGSLDASMISAFVQICNDTPDTDPVVRLGNRVMRTSISRKTSSIVYTLDEFFAKIENMECLALYNELSTFWVNDPYQLQAITDFDAQEKEVVRAIIKWSLALKENEHDCEENDWPNNEQRLAFFTAIKNVIDKTSSLSWLQNDALYGVLIIEINKLQNG